MQDSVSKVCRTTKYANYRIKESGRNVFFSMLHESPGSEKLFTLSFRHFSISRSTKIGNGSLIAETLFSAFAPSFD